MRYLLFILLPILSFSCLTREDPTTLKINSDDATLARNRATINGHVSTLAENLVSQPVMTPRSGFSGYLAHFKVIRTTTKESPFAVIVDGEGYSEENTPSELQDFADLKGVHPYGGTYAFSSSDTKMVGKSRGDSDSRLVLEVPGPKGDGLMAIGFSDGEVLTIKAISGKLDDKRIQAILSIRGQPLQSPIK